MDKQRNIVIVTAADKHYFASLISLLESVKRNSESNICIVFDLGLSYLQEKWMEKAIPSSVQLFKLPKLSQMFDGWDDVNSNSGCFAWKPTVLSGLSTEYENFVWADAGVLITRNLDDLLPVIFEDGSFLVRNYEHINRTWTSDECKVLMATSADEMNSPQIMGNFFSFSLENISGKKLFKDWVEWSQYPKAIKGDRRFHRHDQTILSILAARFGTKITDHQGVATIGRFKKDYNGAIAERLFFVSHRRWLGLIPFKLLSQKKRFIIYLIPLLTVDVMRKYFWRAKWKIRWSFIVKKIYETLSVNK